MNNHEALLETTEQPKPQTINELLPTYYEALGTNPTYETIRSIDIDGHEVAWMKMNGTVEIDLLQQGREGEPWEEYDLYCACDFTKGIGWDIRDDKAIRMSTNINRDCVAKNTVAYMRMLELRHEYKKRGLLSTFVLENEIEVENIVKDLIEKDKAHEFIEAGNGASFWGGHFYLQTLAKIIDSDMQSVWNMAENLEKKKVIRLEGAVVQQYHEPQEPKWEPYLRQELNGYVATASLPANSDTTQMWKFDIKDSEGAVIDIHTPATPLYYQPLFGPDVEDIDNAQKVLKDLIDSAITAKN